MTTLNDIAETFQLLGDWEQRYLYLVELGEQLPPMAETYKTNENKVHGCMSQVWVYPYILDPTTQQIAFNGDCDTSTIKGVLALLIQLTYGKSADEIMQLDVDEFFQRLELHEHLSPNRHVGIYAIVDLMKKQVREMG